RAPKYLGYFEAVLKKSGGPFLIGRKPTYVDLSLFQLIAGLRYAFPSAMKEIEKKVPRVVGVHDRVIARPRIEGLPSTRWASSGTIRNWIASAALALRF